MAETFLGPDLTIVGQVRSSGRVDLRGRVDGPIEAGELTVAEGAVVEGALVAASIRIAGRAKGAMRADAVDLAGTADVEGEIEYRQLSIDRATRVRVACRPRPSDQPLIGIADGAEVDGDGADGTDATPGRRGAGLFRRRR
jgi:cytoskeletal protein CcmA (bactofilin family)